MARIQNGDINFDLHSSEFMSRLYEMQSCQIFADVVLSNKGIEIPVHRVALAAASPFLYEKLISCNINGKVDVEEELKDITMGEEDMKFLVEYIYRGSVTVPLCNMQTILEMGHRLHVIGLVRQFDTDLQASFMSVDQQFSNFPLVPPIFSPSTGNEFYHEDLSCAQNNNIPDNLSINNSVCDKLLCNPIKQDKMYQHVISDTTKMDNIDVSHVAYDETLPKGCNLDNLVYEIPNSNIDFCPSPVMEQTYQSGIQIIPDKDLFEQSLSEPLPTDTDTLLTAYQHQPVSFLGLTPPIHLEPNPEEGACSLEHLYEHCKFDNEDLMPDRQLCQARLKVKDSIGGVSLQDTSQGEKSLLTLLKPTLAVKNAELYPQVQVKTAELFPAIQIESEQPVREEVIEEPVKEQDTIMCNSCQIRFDDEDALTTHAWKQHNVGTLYNCKLCSYETLIMEELVQHGKTHINSTNKQCCFCGNFYKSKDGLRAHLLSHSVNKRYNCTKCSNHYGQRINLVKHMASVHRLNDDGTPITKKYECDECGFQSWCDHYLQLHKKRIHSNEKQHKCEDCEYECSEKTALIKHRRTHTQEKPYMCEVCGSSFSTVSILKRHVQTHKKEKPHKCGICDKRYADKKRLNDHIRKHKSERAFNCPYCDYAAWRNDNLKSHIQRNHKSINTSKN